VRAVLRRLFAGAAGMRRRRLPFRSRAAPPVFRPLPPPPLLVDPVAPPPGGKGRPVLLGSTYARFDAHEREIRASVALLREEARVLEAYAGGGWGPPQGA
jgi:hypothetical protein